MHPSWDLGMVTAVGVNLIVIRDVCVIVGSRAEVKTVDKSQAVRHDVGCDNQNGTTNDDGARLEYVFFVCLHGLVKSWNWEQHSGQKYPYRKERQCDVEQLTDDVQPKHLAALHLLDE